MGVHSNPPILHNCSRTQGVFIVLRLCTGRTAHRGSRGIAILRLCTCRTAHRGSRGIALLFHDQRQKKRVRGQRHAPAALYTRERPSTHCTGGWVGARAGLDRCGIISPPLGFDPRTVQPVGKRYTIYATRPTFLPMEITYSKNTCHEICRQVLFITPAHCDR